MEVSLKILNENLLPYQRRLPKLKDLELISLVLTAEYCYPDRGFYSFQQMHFYSGRLHAVCFISNLFQNTDLSSASIYNIHYFRDIKEQLSDCTFPGDKEYWSSEIQIDVFNYVNIELETPRKLHQKDYRSQFYLFKKQKKRMKRLFLQLGDQIMIRVDYAKSFDGFKKCFNTQTHL
ncbi:hypothetical protein [Chryseobacterium sp. KCF3-3]|uniref:hypothetical protein n=1 Tax=Chryseobacterium sp. KCF3-3 TaxID=3231511 RepID=UPI0038B2A705